MENINIEIKHRYPRVDRTGFKVVRYDYNDFQVNQIAKEAEIGQGDRLDVVLEGNRGQDYVWSLSSLNLSLVKLSQEEYENNDQPGACSLPGDFHFKFDVLGKGTEELTFEYKHSNSVLNKLTLRLTVN